MLITSHLTSYPTYYLYYLSVCNRILARDHLTWLICIFPGIVAYKMNWDRKGEDFGARGGGAFVTTPLAMGRWTSWSKEMMVSLASFPQVGGMLTTGRVPTFTPPSYQKMELVDDINGRPSMQPVVLEMWELDDGIGRYRATVKKVMDAQTKFEENMGRVATTIWSAVGADVRTRVEMILGPGFSQIFMTPGARGNIELWRTCQEASTGAGSDSACAFAQSVLTLRCAQNGVMAYAAEFAARKHDLLDLVTVQSPPAAAAGGAAPAVGMTAIKLVHTILDGQFVLELIGKDPVTNQYVTELTTKAVYPPSEDVTVQITLLKNTADRFAMARRDQGVLQANVAVQEANATNLNANAAAVGAAGTPRPQGPCFNCAKTDHQYANCPAPSAVCTICGEPHLASMHPIIEQYRARSKARGQQRKARSGGAAAGRPGGVATGSPADRNRIRAAMADVFSPEGEAQFEEYQALLPGWRQEDPDVDLEVMSARLAEVDGSQGWEGELQAHMVRLGPQGSRAAQGRPTAGPFSSDFQSSFAVHEGHLSGAVAGEKHLPDCRKIPPSAKSWDPSWGEEY